MQRRRMRRARAASLRFLTRPFSPRTPPRRARAESESPRQRSRRCRSARRATRRATGRRGAPPYPKTETKDEAALEETSGIRPERLKRSGTTGPSPKPASTNPARVTGQTGEKATIAMPVVETMEQPRRSRKAPSRARSASAARRAPRPRRPRRPGPPQPRARP